MTDSEVFGAAADYIERWGLLQDGHLGGWVDGKTDGPACVLGAIASVTKVMPWSNEPWYRWRDRVANACGHPSVATWNDRYATQEEAVSLLRRLAAEEISRG